MADLTDIMLFYGFFLGMTLCAGNLALNRERKQGNLYTVSIFLVGLWLLHIALFSTGIVNGYEYISTGLLPFSYLAVASQYIRYDILVSPEKSKEKGGLIYYLPALAALFIVIIPGLSQEITYDKDMLRFTPVLDGNFIKLPFYFKILHILYPVLFIYHFSLFTKPLIKTFFIWNRKNADQSFKLSRISYFCTSVICASSAIASAGSLFSLSIVKAGLFMGSNAMLLTFILAMRYPDFRARLYEEVQKYRYFKSKVSGLDVQKIINDLEAAMNHERAYAVEGITIRDMAAELEITIQQLSEILNFNMGKNFNSYINGFRVEEAKKILIEKPDMSIIDVAGAVGFSSSSIFSTVFSKSEGVSPKEYRKKNIR
jgi:AraC-like DNA-binding protein